MNLLASGNVQDRKHEINRCAAARQADSSTAYSAIASQGPPAAGRQLEQLQRRHLAPGLAVDGQPVYADIEGTGLKFVVNTVWPLFQDKGNSQYYLLVNDIWLTASGLYGPWSRVTTLPEEFRKPPDSGRFAPIRKMVPPPHVHDPILPTVTYSTTPTEIILFDGQPTYSPIPGTQLVYATNTNSPLFVYSATQTYRRRWP